MKSSDYLASFLVDNHVRQVFGLQGGAVVHLFDSVERHPDVEAIYCHHEQAAALAATAHAKVTGRLGCAIVTTGPASTNALTGLLAAWQDSTPVLFISGQTRIEHTSYGKPVRQVGSQEFAILDVVKPITKYARLVERVDQLPQILVDAATAALTGRKGPVWIDFPVNLQWGEVASPLGSLGVTPCRGCVPPLELDVYAAVAAELSAAQRPLVIAGNGIRSAGCAELFREFVERHELPFVTSWTASDLLPTSHPLNAGIIGVAGQRGANKAAFAADLLICLGSHLGLTQTSTLTDNYAPASRKIIIDIDADQLANLTVHFDRAIHADLGDFFALEAQDKMSHTCERQWLNLIDELRRLNSVDVTLTCPNVRGDSATVNSNVFNAAMTAAMPAASSLVIDGGGTALYTGFQASVIKSGQRIICSSAISAMGTGLPEAIGVSLAAERGEVYCVIGDGSLMLNLQELQTIYQHRLPIKVIVYNNSGYLAIKHTQQAFLGQRYYGTDPQHGLSVPPIERIAQCFDIQFLRVSGVDAVPDAIEQIIAHDGAMLVEVCVPEMQSMLFQQGYRQNSDGSFAPADLSEMRPFL
jgi:acetolactate synthase-1/2/3 large subunit